MLALSDRVFGRLTNDNLDGEFVLGVPHDIVYPEIPQVLRHFALDYPRMRVTLLSSFTNVLLAQFRRDTCDVLLTTEEGVEPEGETLVDFR